VFLTGGIPFTYDKLYPSIASLAFASSGASGTIVVDASFSEASLTTFRYYLSGGQIASWTNTGYFIAHRYIFS
jgi:hypothetical protein